MPHPTKRVNIRRFQQMKESRKPISMVTAYDYNQAMLVDMGGIDSILVGDSLGNVVLGYESTIPVSMDDMLRATSAVARGAKNALIIADMPFGSYHSDIPTAVRNATRFMQESGCQAVKLEGGYTAQDKIRAIVDAGIPVMGHVGFTPQSVYAFGGYRVQGRGDASERVINDARAVQDAGAFSIVLELMPAILAQQITEELAIPTIGIGAGPYCDGQVQVLHDMLGLDPTFRPKHAGRYGDLAGVITDAVRDYVRDVNNRDFPTIEQSHV